MTNVYQLIGFGLGILALGLIIRMFVRAMSLTPGDRPGKGKRPRI